MAAVSVVALSLLLSTLIFRSKSLLNWTFIFMIGSTLIWVIAYTLEIAATDKPTMLFWTYIQYIGILTLPPLFLIFVFAFTNRASITAKPILGLLFFPPFVYYLFLLTNDYHQLFYLSVTLNTLSPFISLDLEYGLLFYTNIIYSYILLCIGYFILIQTYFSSKDSNPLYQKQLIILIIASTIPMVANIIRVFKLLPSIAFLDLTPVSFVIAYLMFAFALFETRFLDIVPIARHQVFTDILDGLMVIDCDWRLLDINSAAHSILLPDLESSFMYGKNIFTLLKNELQQKAYHVKIDEVQRGLEKIKTGMSNKYSTELELNIPFEEIQKRYYDLLCSPLRSRNEKDLLGFVLILREVTDRVSAELTLQQKNRMQDLILKLLSHDLHNHLDVLREYSKMVSEAIEQEGTKEGLLAIEVKSTATLQLINRVTTFLKEDEILRSHPLERCDLNDIINTIIQQLKPESDAKNVTIKYNFSIDHSYVLANFAINSAILNLLTNAIKLSPENGVIEIRLNDENNYWQVSIADQGPGIPEDLKLEVFEPFSAFGTKKGTGLGLTIAREAIQFFLGRIWIEDAHPHGVIFKFKIPKISEG
ncbi:MAG: histidine kinase N-terminal 7TM domain-containing protein [Candidatus Hodarchaeales archaeon]|jgi:signal transduction histidine kinase